MLTIEVYRGVKGLYRADTQVWKAWRIPDRLYLIRSNPTLNKPNINRSILEQNEVWISSIVIKEFQQTIIKPR